MSKLVRVVATRCRPLCLSLKFLSESYYTAARSTLAILATLSFASAAPTELLYTDARSTLSTWSSSRDRPRTDAAQESYYTQARAALGLILTTMAHAPTTPREL